MTISNFTQSHNRNYKTYQDKRKSFIRLRKMLIVGQSLIEAGREFQNFGPWQITVSWRFLVRHLTKCFCIIDPMSAIASIHSFQNNKILSDYRRLHSYTISKRVDFPAGAFYSLLHFRDSIRWLATVYGDKNKIMII